jgi:pyruvate formate lyase activating enzyme
MAPEARSDFYAHIDAANIDLKAFTEAFYRGLCFAHLDPVLDTLRWLRHHTTVWLEVTTLLIPGRNDSEEEVEKLSRWFVTELGAEVPLHFTAFHPDYMLMDVARTPAATLTRAREQARAAGLKHVYTGNVHDPRGQSTSCTGCGRQVIGRDGYEITGWHLDARGRCLTCETPLGGYFDAVPGTWGARRRPVMLAGGG